MKLYCIAVSDATVHSRSIEVEDLVLIIISTFRPTCQMSVDPSDLSDSTLLSTTTTYWYPSPSQYQPTLQTNRTSSSNHSIKALSLSTLSFINLSTSLQNASLHSDVCGLITWSGHWFSAFITLIVLTDDRVRCFTRSECTQIS